MRSYFNNLYSTKLENVKEMDNFLNRYHIPKLNQDLVNNLNRVITYKEIEVVIKSLSTKKEEVQSLIDLVQNTTRTSK